ncbi:MAG: methyltransferase domain-containing protein [Methanomassiliicoccales archaeon]|nr:methyltransferase domain-containing protein [Methanomassiliicoccales archaeon]
MNELAEDLDRAWAKALADTPMQRYSVPEERQREYWNRASRNYDEHSEDISYGYNELLRRLQEAGTVRCSDDVLDIGSGTGLFSLPMAKVVSTLTALERSPEMIETLSRKTNGSDNMFMVNDDWERFVPSRRYDLVFSSFCPAVYNLRSMLRMEACSKRDCCIVAMHDGTEPYFPHMALTRVTGDVFDGAGLSLTYATRMLSALGREWDMDVTTICSRIESPAEEALKRYMEYFSLLMNMDESRSKVLKEVIDEHTSADRMFEFTVHKKIAALHWHAPR